MSARIFLLLATIVMATACNHPIPRLGNAGRYLEGREQFLRGRSGDIDKAIESLEAVVKDDPGYKDSLTLLGRAYYRKERYRDAYAVLQRALAVNKEDEIAWFTLGLTQLRIQDDQRGLESLKGAITLLAKLSVGGYRDYPNWDSNNQVRTAIRRCALMVTKGLESKAEILSSSETLLARMDEEENYQRIDKPRQFQREYGR